jgi:hypothetical protein
MSKENKVMCPLGNGECLPTCSNYEAAKKLSKALGSNFDPKQSRLRILFGDAFSHDVTIFDISNTITNCTKEKRIKKD